MSKIVETQTEFCCLVDNPTVTPNTTLVSQYHSNTARSVAQSYGLIRGIGYQSASASSLEVVGGIPTGANLRIFNTMTAVPLLVQVSCYPTTATATPININMTLGLNGSVTVPSAWRVQLVRMGQAAVLSTGTPNTSLPFSTPTTAAIFWWL